MKRKLLAILLGIALFPVVAGSVLAAITYSAPIPLVNTTATGYDMLSANVSGNMDYMAANVFANAEGLDTRVNLGTTAQKHMLADDRLLFSTPLAAYTSKTLYFTTGNSNLDSFAIIPGYGGYVTTANHSSLDLADNFTVEQMGWVDTTYTEPIVNPDMELETGWTGGSRSDNFSHTGTYSWKVRIPNIGSITSNQTIDSTYWNAGQPVTFMGWIKLPDNFGDTALARLAIYDGVGTSSSVVVSDNTDWTHVSVGRTLAAAASTLQLKLYLYQNNAGAADAYFDDVFLITGGLVHKPNAFATYGSASGNITSTVFATGNITSVTVTGVSSGNMTVETTEQPVLTFDGTGDYVHCGADSSLNAGVAFTIIQWVNFAVDDTTEYILAKFDAVGAATFSYRLYRLGASNFVKWNVFRTDGGDAGAISTTACTKDEWWMIAATFDVTEAEIFINGVSEHTDDLGGGVKNTTANFTIGCALNNGAPVSEFEGDAGQTWAYGVALSEAEILQHFNGTFTDTTDLVGYWKLSEGGGSIAYDSSPETNTGTIVSATWGNEILRLYVDDALEDVEYGGDVPETSDNWTFMGNNSMAYSDNITISISGTQVLWYQPNTLIESQVLPDREGADEDGYFYWGDLPAGITIELGALVSDYAGATVDPEGTQDIVPVITSPVIESDATKTAGIDDPYTSTAETIEELSHDRLPVLLQYWWLYILAGLVFFVWVYSRFPNLIIAGIAFLMPIGFGTAQGIFDFWVIAAMVMVLLGCVLMEGRRAA